MDAGGPGRNVDWDAAARYYDAYVRTELDVPYFLRRAAATGGPVLEVMCGTGRITLPLARAGFRVTGVDLSAGLLARLQAKVAAERLPVRMVEADARTFDLGERFPFVFIGFHALAEVLGRDERRRVFERVRAHLADGGLFVLTLHNPPARIAAVHPEWREMGRFPFEGGRTLVVSSRWSVDVAAQRVEGTQRYRELDSDGALENELDLPVRFDLVGREEVQGLARAVGLEIRAVHGDYDASPYDPARSRFMIFEMGGMP